MGFLYVMMAAVLFGINPSVEEMLLKSGLTSGLIALWVMAGSCFLAGLAAVVRRESFRVSRRQFPALFLAGSIGRGLTEIFLLNAYSRIPAGLATMVHFLFPVIVCLTEAVFFGEEMNVRKWAAVFLSAAGLMGLAGGVSGGSLVGIASAGASSLTFAYYYLMTERSSLGELSPMVMIFWVHVIAVIETAVMVAVQGKWVSVYGGTQILGLAAGGMLCFLGFVFLNRGIPLVGAGKAGFINMMEPVTSVMMSVLLYHIRLSVPAILGCCLILASIPIRSLPGRADPG